MLKKIAIISTILVLLTFGSSCSNAEMVTEDDFVAASSIEILQTTVDELANNNFDLLSKYMKSGDYFVLPKGTKIRILETLDGKYAKCLVLDGKLYIGKEFWTFTLSFKYGSDIPYDLITQESGSKPLSTS